MSPPFLSVVIPAWNEEDRIVPTLEKVISFLRKKPFPSELILSDDGSRDKTVAVAQARLKGFPHQILRGERNEGKGMAVKRGIFAAQGKYVLFIDADHSTPIEETDCLIRCLEDNFDIAIGSRGLPESRVEVHQHWVRETMGKVFNRIARLFTFKGIRDSQCGFKCFKREIAQELFRTQKIKGFAFDVEVLYLAQKKGYRIAELPVTWRNSPQSRVRIFRDSFRMLLDLVRIRWIHSRWFHKS